MRRRRAWIVLVLAAAAATVTSHATAENPRWPPPFGTTPEQLMSPSLWPDDPGYGYDVEGDGMSCIDESGGRCWTNATGGDWNYWSWVPPQSASVDGFRATETTMGAGNWTDMAWQITTGDRSVIIAVLDSGIDWGEGDLVNQYYISRAELEAPGLDEKCLPQPPAGHTGDPVDVDGDGYLTMRDWFSGKSADEAAALRTALDDAGNHNGVADPGDLILLCSDGTDDDDNGYVDDISGWDFFADDNNPASNRNGYHGNHGTGEARWSTAEGNDGRGDIGQCPGCRVLMLRAADSFVGDAQDYAQSVIFAVDSGARVVQEALGTVNNTTYMRRAHAYAYANDVLIVASAADENSFHHNYPATANHTLYVHAIQFAGANAQNARSFLAYNNCSNFGPQLVLSTAGSSCSSEATGVTAGVAGLVYSAGLASDRPGGAIDPPLSAEELRQLILTNADDIWVPESDPAHPSYDRTWYPSGEGWDQRFGHGRTNTYEAALAVREGRIPPEVDIVTPDWFRVIYPNRTRTVALTGRIAARRASSFDYVVEWAPGVEPDESDFQTITMGVGETSPIEGTLATWDVSSITVDNPGDVVNRYLTTVRIRVTAHYGGTLGDVRGEQRRAFHIRRDSSLLPGFPVALGVRNAADEYPAASGEGSPKLADVDGDGKLEIVYADTDGLLHVFNDDATEVPGYPVQLGHLRGLDAADPNNLLRARAYASGAVPSDDVASSVALGVPAIGDVDGDGSLDIVVPTMEGDVYAFHAGDATPLAGFPVGLPEVNPPAGAENPDSTIERGVVAAPALADLDADGMLEIVIAAADGHVYVLRHDGTDQPGFPVEIIAPQLWVDPADARPGRIVTAPAVGDVDGDGIPDIALGSNETGSESMTGAAHLVHGDGNLHAGGPEHANWPIRFDSFRFFPFVGEGIVSPLAMADVNGDGRTDIAVAGTAGRITILDAMQPPRPGGEDPVPIIILDSNTRGRLTSVTDPSDRPLLNTFATGSFGDLDQDGQPDFVTGGAGLKLALNLAGGFANEPFAHQVGAWDTVAGSMLPGFPRRIEDYLFFVSPTVADVGGDEYPEVVLGSAGYYVHAWDACGREPEGWPKLTGGWIAASVAVGDIDGDGLNEAVVATRAGYLFAWNTEGNPNGAMPWPEYRHDNLNSGNYETPLSNGGLPTAASQPIDCPSPVLPDGGIDAGAVGYVAGGACGCRTAAGRDERVVPFMAALVAVLTLGRRRRRRG